MMRLAAAITAFLLAPATAAAQVVDTAATPIPLDQAIRMAQQNAPAAVQARGSIATSEAAVKQSYAAFLPSLSVSAGRNNQRGDRFDTQGNLVPFTGQPTSYSTGLSSSLQLFDGGRRYFDLKRTKAEVDAAAANETTSRYDIALQVKQQYYNILAARESQSAADAQIQQTEQQLRAASLRLRAGAATVSDSLRSVVLLGNARLARLTAQNNLQLANATLTRLVASPISVTAVASDTIDQRPPLPTLAELELLLENAPVIERADAELTAANASVRSAKSGFMPTLNMSFSRGGSGLDPRFGLGDRRYAYSQSLNFSLNFPLFNNLNREVAVARAVVAEDVAEASVRDAKYLVRQTLVQSLGQMRIASEQVDIQMQSVRAAEEDLRVQQRRYELGATTLLDLLTSQTQLDNARTSLIRARYDYRVARAQLEALIGRDL